VPNDEPSQCDLVERCREGDPRAAEALFRRYAVRLARVAEQHLSHKLAGRVGGYSQAAGQGYQVNDTAISRTRPFEGTFPMFYSWLRNSIPPKVGPVQGAVGQTRHHRGPRFLPAGNLLAWLCPRDERRGSRQRPAFRPALDGLEDRALPSFTAPTGYPVDALPSSVAVGDFNRDGIPDLVEANYAGNSFGVLLGRGNGTFAGPVTYGVGAHPLDVAVADLNGDTIPDLVEVNLSSDAVSVLLGRGDGSFGFLGSYAAGNAPASVAVGDFNRDGIPDLVVGDTFSATLSVLLGRGDGSFGPPITYPNGGSGGSSDVEVRDFNRDGLPDLAAAVRGDYVVSVLLGQGGGTFAAPISAVVGPDPASIVAGDFNRDGLPDLAVVNSGGTSAGVLLGRGNGTFAPLASYAAGTDATSVTGGDFNGDSVADLAVANDRGTVSVLPGRGDGTFAGPASYAAGVTPVSVAAGDFNGDGALDLVTANYGADQVSVLLNTGASRTTLSASVNLAAFGQPVTLTAAVRVILAGPGPTGSVTFFDGTTALGSAPLGPDGTATLTVSSLAPGSHALRAAYGGDANRFASAAGPLPLTVLAPPASVRDVTARVRVRFSGLKPHGRQFWQAVTITNTGRDTLRGPLALVLRGLTRKVRLLNQTGWTRVVAPAGRPYLDLAGDLAPGARRTVRLQFSNPTGRGIRYAVRVVAGPEPR
jgi:Bacterial Ig-like domain (group 3)/FG-GAP-like repeat